MAGIIRRQASDPLPLMAAMGNNTTRPFPAEYLIPRLHLVMERPKYDLFHLSGCRLRTPRTGDAYHAGGAGRPCGDLGTRGLGIWQDPNRYGRPAPGQYSPPRFPVAHVVNPTALAPTNNTTSSSAGGATLIKPPTEGPEDVGGRRRRARYEPDHPPALARRRKRLSKSKIQRLL